MITILCNFKDQQWLSKNIIKISSELKSCDTQNDPEFAVQDWQNWRRFWEIDHFLKTCITWSILKILRSGLLQTRLYFFCKAPCTFLQFFTVPIYHKIISRLQHIKYIKHVSCSVNVYYKNIKQASHREYSTG